MMRRARGAGASLRWMRTGDVPQPPGQADERAPTHADPELDTAVYSCSCGLVFEAPVSTSVGCPHCGGQQAW